VTAFLDADTLVVGDVGALLDTAAAAQCCATQFARWQTTHAALRRRIAAWRGLKQDRCDPAWLKQLVDEAQRPRPAVNSGVVAVRRGAAILRPWLDLTLAGRRTFICDEIALQLLLPRCPHRVLDCRYNCSPLYAAGQADVRIWHFHGGKHVRGGAGRQIWWPAYQQCTAANVAGLAEWTPGADSRLRALLASPLR
jgi:hypothetical protein